MSEILMLGSENSETCYRLNNWKHFFYQKISYKRFCMQYLYVNFRRKKLWQKIEESYMKGDYKHILGFEKDK